MHVVKLRKRLVVVWLFTLTLAFQPRGRKVCTCVMERKKEVAIELCWWWQQKEWVNRTNQEKETCRKKKSISNIFLQNFCRCYTLCTSFSLCFSFVIVMGLLSFCRLLAHFIQAICFTMSYIDFFYYFLRVYPRIRYNLFAAFFSCHFLFVCVSPSLSLIHYIHKLVGVETIFLFFFFFVTCYSLHLCCAAVCSLPIKEMICDINHEVGCMKIIQNIKT